MGKDQIKKAAKKYLSKYFKSQYFTEQDDEFKSLVRILTKASKPLNPTNPNER